MDFSKIIRGAKRVGLPASYIAQLNVHPERSGRGGSVVLIVRRPQESVERPAGVLATAERCLVAPTYCSDAAESCPPLRNLERCDVGKNNKFLNPETFVFWTVRFHRNTASHKSFMSPILLIRDSNHASSRPGTAKRLKPLGRWLYFQLTPHVSVEDLCGRSVSAPFPMCCCHSVACGTASQTRVSNAVDYAKFYSRTHDAVIRVYDAAGNVIETHEHAADFKEW